MTSRAPRLATIVALAWLLTGCSVMTLMRGTEGRDVTGIQPGVTRAIAEGALGAPVREWTSPTGVRYAAYEYDTGRAPDRGQAVAAALVDVMTAGIFELVDLLAGRAITNASLGPPTTGRAVLSFDADEIVLGVFDEFDALPADGRSGRRTWRR